MITFSAVGFVLQNMEYFPLQQFLDWPSWLQLPMEATAAFLLEYLNAQFKGLARIRARLLQGSAVRVSCQRQEAPASLSAFCRMALSVVAGVIASGSILR